MDRTEAYEVARPGRPGTSMPAEDTGHRRGTGPGPRGRHAPQDRRPERLASPDMTARRPPANEDALSPNTPSLAPSPGREGGAGAEGVLSAVRVVDFSRVVAGPYCTMLLGDLGADVVKVERPGSGDDCRAFGPPFVAGESTYFLGLNRNKRSLTLNLGDPRGVALARELAMHADVLVESFRPGVMARFGLSYDDLRDANPGLVYCTITGYGSTGPYRDWAGYDVMVSALGGLMGITGTPGGPPVVIGVALVDVCTGLHAFGHILAALISRATTGVGQLVEASLLASDLSVLINAASGYLMAGHVMTPQGSAHAAVAPFEAFRATDGYIMIGAGNNKLFSTLCRELGLSGLLEDPRFATNADRARNREDLVALIEAVTSTRTVAEWMRRLGPAGVSVAPINAIDRVFADPQVVHSKQVVTVDHPTLGPLRMVGPAVRLSATPATVRLAPPTLGQHTEEVLTGLLGLPPAEVEELRRAHVV